MRTAGVTPRQPLPKSHGNRSPHPHPAVRPRPLARAGLPAADRAGASDPLGYREVGVVNLKITTALAVAFLLVTTAESRAWIYTSIRDGQEAAAECRESSIGLRDPGYISCMMASGICSGMRSLTSRLVTLPDTDNIIIVHPQWINCVSSVAKLSQELGSDKIESLDKAVEIANGYVEEGIKRGAKRNEREAIFERWTKDHTKFDYLIYPRR